MSAAHADDLHPVDALEIRLQQARAVDPADVFPADRATHMATALEIMALRWIWSRDRGEDLFDRHPALRMAPSLVRLRSNGDRLALFRLGPASNQEGRGCLNLGSAEVLEIPPSGDGWRPGAPMMLAQQDFSRKLRRRGLPRLLAAGLAGAFDEMASNAREHSQTEVPPVACLQVEPGYWAFSVTDVGRGALSSLRENPKFESLRSESWALKWALQDGVSRHSDPGRGRGFGSVFKALVDRSAVLRFRSGGASGRWTGTSPTAQQIVVQALPVSKVGGFHVCVEGRIAS